MNQGTAEAPDRQNGHPGVEYVDEVTPEQIRAVDELLRAEFRTGEWITVEAEGIRWQRVNDDPFEYAIQQGPFGDEFVKLLNGECLRRPTAPSEMNPKEPA